MTVINTEKWLEIAYHTPEKLYQKISNYFPHPNPKEIKELLIKHGMYFKPDHNWKACLNTWKEKNIWKVIQKEEKLLKQEWYGKDVLIFILPSNTYDRNIREQYNGRAGLAFRDKLFLFISQNSKVNEIKALFTHEYNHCCRLIHNSKKEKNYTLLDLIVMEGLAENAVYERFGDELLAPWTSYYSDRELEEIWKRLLLPNKDLPKTSSKANKILYGLDLYPTMAGYSVGYYLVKEYMRQTSKGSKELLHIPSEEIALINN